MNWAYTHLLLNHIPHLVIPLALALLVFGMLKRSDELKRAALGIFVVTALFAVAIYLTGEPAEEVVEHLPGVSESAIEQHEESALASLIAIELLGLAALAGLAVRGRFASLSGRLVIASLLLAVVAGVLVARTANLGGRIRHTEIRPAEASAPAITKAGPGDQIGSEAEQGEGGEEEPSR